MELLWAWSGDEGPAMSTAVDIVSVKSLERADEAREKGIEADVLLLLQPNALACVPMPILLQPTVLESFTDLTALSCQSHDKVIK